MECTGSPMIRVNLGQRCARRRGVRLARCKRMAEDGFPSCRLCRVSKRKTWKAIRKWRLRRELCRACGGEKRNSFKSDCENCLRRREQLRKGRAERASERGLCRCGRTPVPGFKMCVACRDKTRKYRARKRRRIETSRRRAERLRAQGLCVSCGRAPATQPSPKCSECRAKHAEVERRRHA